MKVIILLAALCSVFADEATQIDPCLTQCREQTMTKFAADPELAKFKPGDLQSAEARTKVRTFLKNYVAGTGHAPAALGNAEVWTKLCTISTEAETCINACPDSPKKEGAKKFLGFFKLGCDADFKAAAPCIAGVMKEKSEACQTKCTPQAAKFNEFIAQRDANPNELVPATKEALESLCKFVNCRLNCRKTDVVNKCQATGFEQAKKFTSAASGSAKMMYKRVGGNLDNWPQICHGDKIVEANEY